MYHQTQIYSEFGQHHVHFLKLCPFINVKIAVFAISALYFFFASIKCNELMHNTYYHQSQITFKYWLHHFQPK